MSNRTFVCIFFYLFMNIEGIHYLIRKYLISASNYCKCDHNENVTFFGYIVIQILTWMNDDGRTLSSLLLWEVLSTLCLVVSCLSMFAPQFSLPSDEEVEVAHGPSLVSWWRPISGYDRPVYLHSRRWVKVMLVVVSLCWSRSKSLRTGLLL